jgi:hypothetical protein
MLMTVGVRYVSNSPVVAAVHGLVVVTIADAGVLSIAVSDRRAGPVTDWVIAVAVI